MDILFDESKPKQRRLQDITKLKSGLSVRAAPKAALLLSDLFSAPLPAPPPFRPTATPKGPIDEIRDPFSVLFSEHPEVSDHVQLASVGGSSTEAVRRRIRESAESGCQMVAQFVAAVEDIDNGLTRLRHSVRQHGPPDGCSLRLRGLFGTKFQLALKFFLWRRRFALSFQTKK
jgi:hypothetical protein